MHRLLRALAPSALTFSLFALAACPAVFPEVGTRVHAPPQGVTLDPPPPPELRWMKFVSARIPEKTRDGRQWGTFGKLPDPYAKLIVNDKELFRTNSQANTLTPTWPDSPHGNFKLGPDDKIRVEIWDNNPLNDLPIGIRNVGKLNDDVIMEKQLRTDLDGGGEVVLAIEPAHALWGLGLWIEIRNDSAYVTRFLQGSPADRAGMKPGDEILSVNGKDVNKMAQGEVQSLFNAVPPKGYPVKIRHDNGAREDVKIAEGPIYPPYDSYGNVD